MHTHTTLSLRAAKMTPTPHPEDFQCSPRAPDTVLDGQTVRRGVRVKIPAPIGAGILTPTHVRAIFSSMTLYGARGWPRKSSGWGVGAILAARSLIRRGELQK